MPEKGISPRSDGTGENPIHIREHLGQKNEDELFEAVWDELEHSEDGADVDVDKILTYMDIMDDINPLPDLDLSSSWKKFEEKYGPVTDGLEPAKQQLPASDYPVTNKRRHRRVKPIRALLVVLCVSVILAIASSCGVIDYIINAFVRWTDETFHFEVTSVGRETEIRLGDIETKEYTVLEDALDIYGLKAGDVPAWYPDGFDIYKIKISDAGETVKLRVSYRREKEEIALLVWRYKNHRPLDLKTVEKDVSIVEKYEHNRVIYYIMKNNNQINVVWVIGTELYTLGGDMSTKEAKMIIDSISKEGNL